MMPADQASPGPSDISTIWIPEMISLSFNAAVVSYKNGNRQYSLSNTKETAPKSFRYWKLKQDSETVGN